MSDSYLIKAIWQARNESGLRINSCLRLLKEHSIPISRVFSRMASVVGSYALKVFKRRLNSEDFSSVSFRELALFESIVSYLVRLSVMDAEAEGLFETEFSSEDYNI